MSDKDAAIRKRQQIDSSKKMMFTSVAIAAFVLGIALVTSIFLIKQIGFHGKIVAHNQRTLSTIEKNKTAAEELKKNIRVMDTNEALSSVRLSDEGSALQVVLDALPSTANVDALGSSLQDVFVGLVDGLGIDSLNISLPTAEAGGSGQEIEMGVIPFHMTVSGSTESLNELLSRFERSIRVIGINSMDVQAGSIKQTMTIQGEAYYMPGRVIKLGTKVQRPDGK